MSFVFDLFRKKKDTPTTFHASNTSLNETVDNDGFLVYGAAKNESENPPVPDQHKVLKSQVSLFKPTEDIPFEFSPVYKEAWTSGTSKCSVKLRQIDWDKLQYDFTLEKSILHS